MTLKAIATSSTHRPIGPTASCVCEIGTTPDRLINPRVGLHETSPFALAGLRSEFTVSLPVPSTASEAAIAAPVPPELPPGVHVLS